ncbi:hypothetical protein KXX35_009465, partial [Aspergillus fumigatus]
MTTLTRHKMLIDLTIRQTSMPEDSRHKDSFQILTNSASKTNQDAQRSINTFQTLTTIQNRKTFVK